MLGSRKVVMSEGKKKRKDRQHKHRLYSQIREDLQLSGKLPTTPEGSLRSEVVNPTTQTDAPQPGLVAQALRNGWAVPDERKPRIVDELLKLVDDSNLPAKVRVAAFNALRMADREQYERDNPEEVAKLKGGSNQPTVNVNQTNTTTSVVQVGEVFSDITTIEKRVSIIVGEPNETNIEDIDQTVEGTVETEENDE